MRASPWLAATSASQYIHRVLREACCRSSSSSSTPLSPAGSSDPDGHPSQLKLIKSATGRGPLYSNTADQPQMSLISCQLPAGCTVRTAQPPVPVDLQYSTPSCMRSARRPPRCCLRACSGRLRCSCLAAAGVPSLQGSLFRLRRLSFVPTPSAPLLPPDGLRVP